MLYPIVTMAVFGLAAPAVRMLIKSDRTTAGFAIVGILASMSFTLEFFYNGYGAGVFANLLRLDAFSALFLLLFQFVALYVVIASVKYVDKERHVGEYYSLILLATTGMMVVAMSLDLITLFVGIELTSLSSYALVAFRKKDQKSGGGGDEVLHHRRTVLGSRPIRHIIAVRRHRDDQLHPDRDPGRADPEHGHASPAVERRHDPGWVRLQGSDRPVPYVGS